MGRHVLWFLASIGVMTLVIACTHTVAPPSTTMVPTTAPAKPTAAPASAPATPESVADVYVRALFAKDTGTMVRAFPASKPDADRDEYNLQLDGLAVQPLTPEQAGDKNPVTKIEYARAVAKVSAKGKAGTYTYTIGTRVENGKRVVGMVSRMADW